MDGLWEVVELCWAHQPSARPSVEEVLRYLGKVSQILEPCSLGANGEMCEGGDWDSASDISKREISLSGTFLQLFIRKGGKKLKVPTYRSYVVK